LKPGNHCTKFCFFKNAVLHKIVITAEQLILKLSKMIPVVGKCFHNKESLSVRFTSAEI